jgi:putative DNA primase/helicase
MHYTEKAANPKGNLVARDEPTKLDATLPDISEHIEKIARRLLGQPDERSTTNQIRFGPPGLVWVDIGGPYRGKWTDFMPPVEQGGPWDLIRAKTGLVNGDAVDWLKNELGILVELPQGTLAAGAPDDAPAVANLPALPPATANGIASSVEPPWRPAPKWWLKAHPPALDDAACNAYAPRPNGPLPNNPPPAPPHKHIITLSAPYDTAKLFVEERFTADGKRCLHFHQEVFYRWRGPAYSETDTAELRAALYRFLSECGYYSPAGSLKPVKPNTAMVTNVQDALRAVAILDKSIAPPAWINPREGVYPANEFVACTNGLLHLPTSLLWRRTPQFFTLNAVDFAFDEDAPEPVRWLAFLRQLWPDDDQAIETLQELFGYCLTPDTSQQKMFLMIGPKRSGKGTIARVLTRLVGPANAVAPTLAGLGSNFGLAPLIGKRLAIVSDARLGQRADQHAIAERLLNITGEDSITIDRKFLSAWTGRLQTRFLILANELPRLADASGALASRFIVLVMTESFYGREDPALTNKLLPEMPGILNWAIDGWRRLRQRGYFRQPASGVDAAHEMEDLGSPVLAFVKEQCEAGPGFEVAVDVLYSEWCMWCGAHGRDRPGTSQTFGRLLRAAVPGLKTTQPRGDSDKRHRQYEGIRIVP